MEGEREGERQRDVEKNKERERERGEKREREGEKTRERKRENESGRERSSALRGLLKVLGLRKGFPEAVRGRPVDLFGTLRMSSGCSPQAVKGLPVASACFPDGR